MALCGNWHCTTLRRCGEVSQHDHGADMVQKPRSPIRSGHIVQLALYQPDMAPNFGAAIRLTGCLGVGLDFIEPCGFPLSDRALKRAALDYGDLVTPVRHTSFTAFCTAVEARGSRLIAVETAQATGLTGFAFRESDCLLVGRETSGLPRDVLECCAARVTIPMVAAARSLNVINAAAIALGEALRQTRWNPARL
jgi:tRNA (cytidine/uridine-2'-O-)-methyltransferase